MIVKPNEMEAMRALNLNGAVTLERMAQAALALSERSGRPALITLGENGCLAAEDGRVAHIPARRVSGPTDICGAGDSFLAALAAPWAAGRIYGRPRPWAIWAPRSPSPSWARPAPPPGRS